MNDPQIDLLIRNGRSTATVPDGQFMVPVLSVWELLQQQMVARPDHLFYRYFNADLTWSEWSFSGFGKAVTTVEQFFVREGFSAGSRVALAGSNHPWLMISMFAAWKSGLCVVPLNLTEDDHRLQYIISNAEPVITICLPEALDRIQSVHPSGRIASISEIESLPAVDHTENRQTDQRAQEALIIYTSGTTGNPKGVVLSQYQLLVDAFFISDWQQITEQDHFLSVLPTHHVNGIVVTHLTPLVRGARISMLNKFSTSGFIRVVRDEGITISSVVPTLLQFLVEGALADSFSGTSLRHVICGAGPLTVELALRFENHFKIPIIHGYGLSETTCYSCFLPVGLPDKIRQQWLGDQGFPSIGVPLGCNDMDIQDDQGQSLPEHTRGEIVIRGHNVMNGYYQNPEANLTAFSFGWFRSGDEGFFLKGPDGNRYFFITGRFKELIIRGGVNLSPLEIDEVINRCPGVKAGLAIGFENDWYGEEVGALVQKADPELTEESVLIFLREQLPWSKCPKVVVFSESIPVTSTGKYQRNKVKGLFSAWKTTQFKSKEK